MAESTESADFVGLSGIDGARRRHSALRVRGMAPRGRARSVTAAHSPLIATTGTLLTWGMAGAGALGNGFGADVGGRVIESDRAAEKRVEMHVISAIHFALRQ